MYVLYVAVILVTTNEIYVDVILTTALKICKYSDHILQSHHCIHGDKKLIFSLKCRMLFIM